VISASTGEFILKNRPNGGTVVMLRTSYITFLYYSLSVLVFSITREDIIFWTFSWNELRINIGDTLPWLGAIFAGVYVALYTRFSSQWSYLAGLYNQLMSACLTLSEDQKKSSTLVNWKAAFVEDAMKLHPATKSEFAVAVKQMLQDDEVRSAFLHTVDNGRVHLETLQKKLAMAGDIQRDRVSREAKRVQLMYDAFIRDIKIKQAGPK